MLVVVTYCRSIMFVIAASSWALYVSFRCIDFVTYYPDQKIPLSGSCGYDACGGTLVDTVELAANSDFNRTFGTADASCPTDEEVRGPRSLCGPIIDGMP